jgi:hypothetical protein
MDVTMSARQLARNNVEGWLFMGQDDTPALPGRFAAPQQDASASGPPK